MGDSILKLTGVSKDYQGAEGQAPLRILKNVDLEIRAGESIAIAGPSGSGKSTLLNLIGALDMPTAGQVLFKGRNVTEMREAELADFRNREIGFIFQAHHLLPQCSVLENALVPTLASKNLEQRQRAPERAKRLLERVGLGERLHHRPGQISGGERQRAAVVRALINSPSLLLADEPTGALDQASAENLARLLVELNREEGIALIVVTHSLNLAEKMSRICRIQDGTLQEG